MENKKVKIVRVPYGSKDTLKHLREYRIDGKSPVGTIDEISEFLGHDNFEIVDESEQEEDVMVDFHCEESEEFINSKPECTVDFFYFIKDTIGIIPPSATYEEFQDWFKEVYYGGSE